MPAVRASQGFVGSVQFTNIVINSAGFDFAGDVVVRATAADIRAKQEINYPDVVDGRIDRTVYQLGPRVVDGTVSFPLVHEGANVVQPKDCGTSLNHGQIFWALTTQRDQFGRLQNDSMQVRIRYTDDTAFIYPNCLIDSLGMSVANEGMVEMNLSVIGGANSTDDVRIPDDTTADLDMLSPARVVTWNDFTIRLYADDTTDISGDWIRQFDVTVNNNADRFYTLNNRLAPQDIAARKRTIDGRIVLMGRNKNLSELAYNNQSRFTSTAKIGLGYRLGSNGTPVFATVLAGVVFQIEEIGITNDLVETTVPFTALADCECGYEATEIGAPDVALPDSVPSCGAFGGQTSPAFPDFRPE